MNPLLHRLFEDRSKSKSRRHSLHREEPSSLERPLVPKIAKVKLEALPDVAHRKPTAPRVYVGRLPSMGLKTQEVRDPKDNNRTRTNFRNRKLSTSIRDLDAHFFSTELDLGPTPFHLEPTLPTLPNEAPSIPVVPVRGASEEEVFEYLRVLQENEELKEEFCYMNRGKAPYSFFMVEFQRRAEEYLTVSLRGITHVSEGESEFYTLRRFRKEIELYRRLRTVPFFRDYLKAKVTMHWKQHMIRRKLKLKARYLALNLFSQNMPIQAYLHFLHGLGEDYAGGNFFNFNINFTLTLQQFDATAQQGVKDLLKSVKKFDQLVEKQLRSTLEAMLTKFRSQERVNLGSGEKEREKGGKEKGPRQEEAYLPFDAKKRSMKYTQMAKLKEFEWMMYRLVKYTDIVRFNVKIALVRKCYANSIADLRNLRRAYENKDSIRFTNWIDARLFLTSESITNAELKCQPSPDAISESVMAPKEEFLKQMFKEHKLLIEKKESFFCENLQEEDDDEKPSKFQLKYFILKHPEFEELSGELSLALRDILSAIQQLLDKQREGLLAIHNRNIAHSDPQFYMDNTHMRAYLTDFRQDQVIIANSEEVAEFALAAIRITDLKEQVRKSTEEKYKAVATAVPTEASRRCDVFLKQLREVYNDLKENPYTVEEYIAFAQRCKESKGRMGELEKALEELLEFEDIVYRQGIRVGETAKISIGECQTYFKELNKRYEEIETNEQATRKKFQTQVYEMLPAIETRSDELLTEIAEDSVVNNAGTQVKVAFVRLLEIEDRASKVYAKKEELFSYEDALKLGHRTMESYDKLQEAVRYLRKVWESRQHYFRIEQEVKSLGFGSTNSISVEPLLEFTEHSQTYASVLQCYDLLQQFKQQALALLKTVRLGQLLSADTLQPEHISQLKQIVKGSGISVDYLFSKEGKGAVSCEQLKRDTNAQEAEDAISQVVFQSAQESIVKAQLQEIQQFWRRTKIKLISEDIAGNQQPTLHLALNEQLHEKLGSYLVALKNIEGSPHILGLARERAGLNLKACSYVREVLWRWEQVEREWSKLLPLMTNCPAVKHQSNVFFEFTAVDTALRKVIRQVSEMSSLRKLTDDSTDGRYLAILNNCQQQLVSINKVFGLFLQNKRSTYGRFCFLGDHELVQVLQHVKDAKSASKWVNLCFNCESLALDNELASGMRTGKQIFKLRKTILRGEPDEIFRNLQDNMRSGLKFQVRALIPKMKLTPNPVQELQEFSLQVTLVADRLLWTEQTQLHLNATTFQDYKLVLQKNEEMLVTALKASSPAEWAGLAVRLLQYGSMKEAGGELVRDQATISDFKWKEQLRFYPHEEDISVCQFATRMVYGCEYYPPSTLQVPTLTSSRLLYAAFQSWGAARPLVVSGSEGEGKRHLLHQAASYFGCYQKEVVCSPKLSAHFVSKFVQGAIAAGVWLSFYEFDALNYSVCAQLMDLVSKIEPRPQQPLFMLVHHTSAPQQLSPRGFYNFSLCEPDHQKIATILLQLMDFKQHTHLATKLMRFLKAVRPFLDRVMGSDLNLQRKVIQRAWAKKKQGSTASESRMIGEAIQEEIIGKEREDKLDLLSKALGSYFEIDPVESTLQQTKYLQKKQTLSSMISSSTNNIIVLGQRSCKSTLIKQALQITRKTAYYLFAQTNDNYFGSEAMQWLRTVSKDAVMIYDASEVVGEWADLISCGYLFKEGRRVQLHNQILMELRDIGNCSPSFVGKCHILYLGRHLVTPMERLTQHLGSQHPNLNQIAQGLRDLCGENIDNISDTHFNSITKFMSHFRDASTAKTVHRIITWLLSIMGKENLWTRHYGGRYTDFTLANNTLQLQPIDPGKWEPQNHPILKRYLIVPTRASTLVLESTQTLLKVGLAVHLQGPAQSGKSSLLQLLHKKLMIGSQSSTQEWSQQLKKKYTFIRRQGKNVLVDLQKQGHRIVVDDLDLGTPVHLEFLRILNEHSTLRDKYFQEYMIEKYQLVSCGRNIQSKDKFWSTVCKISLKQLAKDSLQTIIRGNFAQQIHDYNMNREVQELINGSIVKAMLISQDDLGNLVGSNSASALLLGLLRNLLSLPRRQAYLSADDYLRFFKTHFHFKLHEKSTQSRLQWQITSVEDNILKVLFGQSSPNVDEFVVNLDGQFKPIKQAQMEVAMLRIQPNLICFSRLIQNVLYLINQFRCMDRNLLLFGRKGTGKKLILKICGTLTSIPVVEDISDAIISAIRMEPLILIDSLDENTSFYEQLLECESDKELAKLIKIEKRQQYYTRVAGEELNEGKMLSRCKEMITHAFITQKRQCYQRFCERRREVLNLPICLLEQWPPEAILNMVQIKDTQIGLHAQLFTLANKALINSGYPTFSLKMFEKYLKVYGWIMEKLSMDTDIKIDLHTKIHFKFSQSCNMISSWQARVEILRKQLEETIAKAKKIIVANQLFTFALSIFFKQIKSQEENYALQTAELKKLNADIDKRMVLMKKVMNKIEKIVASFQRTELGELKKIYKLNRIIYFGVECLCILLGEDSTEEKAINRLLADSNLLMKMKDPQLLAKRNPKLQAKVSKQLPNLEYEIRTNTNELSKTLIEWVRSIIDYWETNHEFKMEQQKHAQAQSSLETSSRRHQDLTRQVEQTNKEIDYKNSVIAEYEKIKLEKEEELNAISLKLRNAEKILPILKHEEADSKEILDELTKFKDNLKGNVILTAITATFLSLQPLNIKKILLDSSKAILKKNFISYSKHFMSQISGKKIDSLESLNYYLLSCTDLPKVVYDPHRKFLNYIQINAPAEVRQAIIENAQQLQTFEQTKIYHTTLELKHQKDAEMLIVDWEAVALQEKEVIFLKLAEQKKPEYFEVKNELQIQINRNIQLQRRMKQELFIQICQRQMKIIEDTDFVENSIQLKKLEDTTDALKEQALQKIKQIEELSLQINEEVTKVISIFQTLKKFRKVDLALMLDVCCQEGDTVQNFIGWSLANMHPEDRNAFLITLILAFRKEKMEDLLKDIIHKTPLKPVETKLKKPQLVSSKYWDIVVKLSGYSANFKKLLQNVPKYQKQFELWCLEPLTYFLPQGLAVEQFEFSQHLALLVHLKPKVATYLLPRLIENYLPYSLKAQSNKKIVQSTDIKLPIIIEDQIDWVVKICKNLNQGKYKTQRVSKINGEVEMKKLLWQSMEAREWIIFYDIQTPKDIKLMEDVAYYVMNYDKQIGFRVFLVIDYQLKREDRTVQQQLVLNSTFLDSISVHLYEEEPSCEKLLAEYNIEYQVSVSSENQQFTNKHVFNRIYRMIVVCYTAITQNYPSARRIDFGRLAAIMSFIKTRNISLEFNSFSIVQYMSKMMSFTVEGMNSRRQIEEIWDLIVDQSKIGLDNLLQVPIGEDSLDQHISNNHQLIGCEKSHFIRKSIKDADISFEKIGCILNLEDTKEQTLAFLRSQLGKLPIILSQKDVVNKYRLFYRQQLALHNQTIANLKNFLQELNDTNIKQDYLEVNNQNDNEQIELKFNKLSSLLKLRITQTNMRIVLPGCINRLRKQHDFLLYFNPTLPLYIVDPNLVENVDLFIGTYQLSHLESHQIIQGFNYLPFFQFKKAQQQKDLNETQGIYLTNLNTQQFVFNVEMRTIDQSYETDGIEPAPLIAITLKQSKLQAEEPESVELELYSSDKKIYEASVEYTAVFREWGLRGPKLITQ